MGASGESPTPTPTAKTAPRTTAPRIPSVAPQVSVTGSAPRARRTSRSSPSDHRPLLMARPPMSSVTMPATAPNTPRAIASGLLALSTGASVTEVTWKV